MSDYSGKVYRKIGGNELVVEPGGTITIGGVAVTCDADGNIIFTGLPTSDPSVAGALWNSTGTLTVSAG
jgi:hypothetical protein